MKQHILKPTYYALIHPAVITAHLLCARCSNTYKITSIITTLQMGKQKFLTSHSFSW